jgi:hypothetical protein
MTYLVIARKGAIDAPFPRLVEWLAAAIPAADELMPGKSG